MIGFLDPKFVIAYTIVLGFGAAYIHEPSETMNGALIAAFAGAWGYYLGSSNSSNAIRDQVGKALDIGVAMASSPPVDGPTGKPGDPVAVKEEK